MSPAAFDTLAQRLTERARTLGEAVARSARDRTAAWRDARLLWPLFASDQQGNDRWKLP